MSTDIDLELSPDQWEALRALRNATSRDCHVKRYLLDHLASLGLVAVEDGAPSMTPAGRRVLVRGSCQLLDLAA